MAANPIILEFQTKGLDEMINLTKKSSDALDGLDESAEGAVGSIAELAVAVDTLQKRLVTLDKGSKEFKLLSDEIDAANIQLKAFTQSGDSMVKQVRDNTNELIKLRIQLKEMEDAGLTGTVAYKTLGKTFDELSNRTGNLKNKIKDVNKEVSAIGSNTSGIDKMVRGVNLGVNAVTGLQAATALFGAESESLQKTLVQLNAAMLFSNSLQQIGTELTREDTIVSGLVAGAKKAWAAATTLVTEASVGLRIALSALGIGALIALVYAAVQAYKFFTQETDKLLKSKEDLLEINKKEIDQLKEELKYRVAIGELSQQQADEKLVLTLKQQQLTAAKDVLRANQELEALRNKSVTDGRLQYQKELDIIDAQKKLATASAVFKATTVDLSAAVTTNTKALKDNSVATKEVIEAEKELKKVQADGASLFQLVAAEVRERIAQAEDTELARKKARYEKDLANFIAVLNAKEAAIRKAAQDERDAVNQSVTQQNLQENELFEKRKGYAIQAINSAIGLATAAQQANQVRTQKELANLEEKKRRGIITEKQYQKELAAIKNEEARKERRAAIIQAFLNIPLAISSQLAKGNIIAAAIAGALATVQAGIVAAAPLPKFRHGGEVFRGHGFVKGKSHSMGGVNAELEGNEFVHRVAAVKHYGVDFMKDINALKFPKAMAVKMNPKQINHNVTHNEFGQELQYIGQYIKQGNEVTVTGNNLLKRIAENTRTKNGYA